MHTIPKLNKKELRDFGLLTGAIVAILFGLLIPWLRGHSLPTIPWAITSILWCLALVIPKSLEPIYQVWMRIGLVLGFINTRIILGIIFYGLVTPMGFIMRLFNDPMSRKFEDNSDSYRLKSQIKNKLSMEKPF